MKTLLPGCRILPPAGSLFETRSPGCCLVSAFPLSSVCAPHAVCFREGAAQETGNAVWDPLGLADLGSPATLAWFRHAELKHGRVAMAAFTGWLVAVSGIHFPGYLSSFQVPVTFEEISKLGPMEQVRSQ